MLIANRTSCKRAIPLRLTRIAWQVARKHTSAGAIHKDPTHSPQAKQEAQEDEQKANDPRLKNVDDLIEDKFAVLKSSYDVPKV